MLSTSDEEKAVKYLINDFDIGDMMKLLCLGVVIELSRIY